LTEKVPSAQFFFRGLDLFPKHALNPTFGQVFFFREKSRKRKKLILQFFGKPFPQYKNPFVVTITEMVSNEVSKTTTDEFLVLPEPPEESDLFYALE